MGGGKKNPMKPELKPLLTGLLIFILIICVYLVFINTVDISPVLTVVQDECHQPVGEIFGNTCVNQSFVSEEDYLTRVDIRFATYARKNTKEITFKIYDAPTNNNLVNISVNAEEIIDNEYFSFKFDPIVTSAGKKYFFSISSPNSSQGNAITIWSSNNDRYEKGSAYVNNQILPGDLSFRIYNKWFFGDYLKIFIIKVKGDIFFFICYSLLLLIISTGILVSFIKRKG